MSVPVLTFYRFIYIQINIFRNLEVGSKVPIYEMIRVMYEPYVVPHAYNPSAQEAEVGKFQI